MNDWRHELARFCEREGLELDLRDVDPQTPVRYDIDHSIHGKRANYCFPAAKPVVNVVPLAKGFLASARTKGKVRKVFVTTANDSEFRAVFTDDCDVVLGWTRHEERDDVYFAKLNRIAVETMAYQIPVGSRLRGNDLVLHVPRASMGEFIHDLEIDVDPVTQRQHVLDGYLGRMKVGDGIDLRNVAIVTEPEGLAERSDIVRMGQALVPLYFDAFVDVAPRLIPSIKHLDQATVVLGHRASSRSERVAMEPLNAIKGSAFARIARPIEVAPLADATVPPVGFRERLKFTL